MVFRALAQFKGSEKSPGLLEDFKVEYIKLYDSPSYCKLNMVQWLEIQFETYGEPTFDSRFMQFVFRISGL